MNLETPLEEKLEEETAKAETRITKRWDPFRNILDLKGSFVICFNFMNYYYS